jgi:hypothetical protein
MSLKAFHLVFITASVLLALGIGVGCLTTYFGQDGAANLLGGIGALAAGCALIVYETWFIRKSRRLS